MRRVIVFGISISSAILHFVIGGFAVALASIMADKVGGKLGGIIATMPAVYLAAIIALAIDHKGQQLIQMSIHLSTGAIVGIVSCIVTVFFTSIFIGKKNYRSGLKMKLAIIKFSVGGLAVLISYIVSVVLPWKEFGGIFATFPAVFLVSMCITGMQFGNEVAMHVSRGAVFGMIGVLCSILATWGLLQATHMWLLSIIGGFVAWFVSALIIFEIVEFIAHKRRDKHGWKTKRSNNQ